ncbi:hypothetical protein E2C01_064252 [Portunus trituberculatus]|uniref:Uncharacterized protein n=1 Tax=Portunus trituberculatus TaxID=210409 RepID=A0A5B7HL90_PORTR|nr:hypothetical protein [Portunus trituberculatus]
MSRVSSQKVERKEVKLESLVNHNALATRIGVDQDARHLLPSRRAQPTPLRRVSSEIMSWLCLQGVIHTIVIC